MRHRVRVHLEVSAEVRATLAAQMISVEGSTTGSFGPEGHGASAFTARVHEAKTPDEALTRVRTALRRWGDVAVEPLDPAD